MSFDTGWDLSIRPEGNDIILFFKEETVLFNTSRQSFYSYEELLPFIGPKSVSMLYIGSLSESRVFLCINDNDRFENLFFEAVRTAMFCCDQDLFLALSAAKTSNHWIMNNRYCGRCGSPSSPQPGERAIVCTSCGNKIFPKISPAVIIAVCKADEVLLAHNKHFPEGLYSLIAGFVDPGEDIFTAAMREVREETGIIIKNIRFFSSQPWPFPDSLMIGLIAEYSSGHPTPDDDEIEDAGWFGKTNLPLIPRKGSIARKILEYLYPHLREAP